MKNPKKNGFHLLIGAVFLHLISLSCSVYRDIERPPKGCHKLIEANYGLTFFGGWCGGASLITIVYFIYRLFKKSNHNYFDKVFDLIVINANIITISIFTISAILRLLPLPRSDELIPIFSGKMSSRKFGGFYSIIGHYLAPTLTIVYFARRKISLAQTYFERRQLFLYSFLNPIIYLLFIFVRPNIPGADKHLFAKDSKYPYFFFEGIMGDKSFQHIIGGLVVIAIIFFGLFIFGSATLFFWGYSNHKIKEREKTKVKLRNI